MSRGRDVPSATARRWRRLHAEERAGAAIYRDLARRRTGEERAVLLGLAEAEERHAAHWAELLGPEQAARPGRIRLRTRLLGLLARRFGSVFVLALVQQAEGGPEYAADRDAAPSMHADEQVHEEVVRNLAARGRANVSGTFRAAVFGANDGLVSNLALILGVVGGGVGARTVLLTGLAGLLAGALSMAAGEFVSVRSQRELLDAGAPPRREILSLAPHLDVDANELALVYRARGMTAAEAAARAEAMLDPGRGRGSADPAGETPAAGADDVVGSALSAAVSSFCAFGAGAAVPVLPFLVAQGRVAVLAACLLVGVALLLTGATVGVVSGGAPLPRALRQLAIGSGAASVTYLLGALLSTTV